MVKLEERLDLHLSEQGPGIDAAGFFMLKDSQVNSHKCMGASHGRRSHRDQGVT